MRYSTVPPNTGRHRTRRVALLCCGILASLAEWSCATQPVDEAPRPSADRVHDQHLQRLEALQQAMVTLDSTLAVPISSSSWTDTVHQKFFAARTAYKRVEPLIELYLPNTADLLNGPALDDMAEDDPSRTIPPEGFQVLEEILFPTLSAADSAGRADARTHVSIIRANVQRAHDDAAATPFTDAAVFDALRLEVARLATVGMAGFDSPVANRTVPEVQAALRGVQETLSYYRSRLTAADGALADSLWARLSAADRVLQQVSSGVALDDAWTFDRLGFLTNHLQPIAGYLLRAQQALGVAMPTEVRAWRAAVASPFERDAFEPLYFAPSQRATTSMREVALGKELFFDRSLSRTGARSCATCHEPSRAFTDGKPRSLSKSDHSGATSRNAPTVLNSGLQNATFTDLRTVFLEDQVADVIRNPDEMHGSLEMVAAAKGLSAATIKRALASYMRSLTSLNAPFDRYVRGERSAMSPSAQRGYNTFMGKAKCGTCHFAPLFNGAIPPMYQKTESEVLGVPSAPVFEHAVIDRDIGRQGFSGLPIHRYAFKTPTLRNVALTAPYMHNGVYRTLEEVIEFYDRGGGAGIGIMLPNQTLPPEPLKLTGGEKRDLVAFMQALTDVPRVPGH